MPIVCTAYWAKPIPTRSFDYSAWYDGQEESGEVGHGETLMKAVFDLLKNYPPRCVDCDGKGGKFGFECATCEGSGERCYDDPLDPIKLCQ